LVKAEYRIQKTGVGRLKAQGERKKEKKRAQNKCLTQRPLSNLSIDVTAGQKWTHPPTGIGPISPLLRCIAAKMVSGPTRAGAFIASTQKKLDRVKFSQ